MMKVLVADTDRHVQEVIRLCLEEVDPEASVESVSTGCHAASAIENRRFDFAILEVSLPDLSGLQVAERAVGRNLPVLLMAAGPDGQVALNQFDFPRLGKPFTLNQFLQETDQLSLAPADNVQHVRMALARMRNVMGAA